MGRNDPDQTGTWRKWTRNRDLQCIALLFLFAVLHFLPSMITGDPPSGFDALYDVEPWKGYRGKDSAVNPVLFDDAQQMEPWKFEAAEALRNGEMPLWNPDSAAGVPFVGNDQSAVFYPLRLPFYLWPNLFTQTIILFLKLFLAGLFAYGFLRRISVRPWYALFGALGFGLGGTMTLFKTTSISSVAVFLPGLFLSLRILRDRVTWARTGFLAVIVACIFFGGHSPTAFHLAVAAMSYFVFLLFQEPVNSGKSGRRTWFVTATAGAVFLGVCVASVHLVPYLQYLTRSIVYEWRTSPGGHPFGRPVIQSFAHLPMLLFPGMYGTPLGGAENYVGSFFRLTGYAESNGGFFGVLPLFLSGWGIWYLWGRSRVKYFAGFLAFGLVLGYKIPFLAQMVERLPLFSLVKNGRLDLYVCFAGSVLAALFLQEEEHRDRLVRLLPWAAGGSIVLLGVIVGGSYLFESSLLEFVTERARSLYEEDLGAPGHTHTWSYWEKKIPFYLALGRRVVTAELLMFAAITGSGAILLREHREEHHRWRGWMLLGLVLVLFLDLSRGSMHFVPAMSPEHHRPELQSTTFLREHTGTDRFLGMYPSFSPGPHLMYDYRDIRNYDTLNLRRVVRFKKLAAEWIRHGAYEMKAFQLERPDLFQYLSVRYVGANRPIHQDHLDPVFSGEGVHIYRYRPAEPLYQLAGQWAVCSGQEDVWRRLEEGTNPSETALLEKQPTFSGSRESYNGSPEVEITDYSRHAVEISVNVPNRSMLVSSEAYYPGWTVTVDGEEAEVHRVNGAFRGVPVNEGHHRVEFQYRPDWWPYCMGISLGALFVVFGLIGYAMFRRT